MAFQLIALTWLSVMSMLCCVAAVRILCIQHAYINFNINSLAMRRQVRSVYMCLAGAGAGIYLGLCAVHAAHPGFYSNLLGLVARHY